MSGACFLSVCYCDSERRIRDRQKQEVRPKENWLINQLGTLFYASVYLYILYRLVCRDYYNNHILW